MANGTSTSQNRRRRICRMSSGVYFLPGSIRSPRAVVDWRPGRQIKIDRLTADMLGQIGRHDDGAADRPVVVTVVGAEGQVSAQGPLDSCHGSCGVVVVVPS